MHFSIKIELKGGAKMQIRQIHQHDFAQVDQLIRTAFENSEHGYGNESELVDQIRLSDTYDNTLELVAVLQNEVVGTVY